MTDSQASETSAQIPAPAETVPAPRWLAWAARRPLPLLALLGLLLWLPGILSLPPLDRDESRFAQSSRQMVQTGDWVDIRLGHVPRYKKPVGIYWLQAAATSIAGGGSDHHIWTYRLPSLLGAIGASWLTLWAALAVTGAEAAFLSGLLMLGSVLLTAEATIATTDAVLLACALAVQGVLLRLYRAARDPEAPPVSRRVLVAGWIACAAGILVKFPVVPGIALATILGLLVWDFWQRRKTGGGDLPWAWLSSLKWAKGFFLTFLLISPWLIAITIQSQGAFLEQSLGNDFASKIAGGQESHGAWPGYYLLLSAATFWPAILFVLPGVLQGLTRCAEPGIRFLLVWAASWWLVVELVPTKLPHYVLGAYPPLAILAAMFVLDPRPVRFLAVARWIALVQFIVGAVLFTAAILVLPRYFGAEGPWNLKTDWPPLAAAGIGAILALTALILALRKKFPPAAIFSVLALFVFAPALTAYVAPRLDQLWVTQRLKHLVALASEPGDPAPALAGYQEPSMLFAFGADVVLSDGAGAADAVTRRGGLALVEESERGPFLARLAELQADATVKSELDGFNYSRGRNVHVIVYRVARLKDIN
jgi:4-amino-4-deoxy-L-arabinose transferase-like glycosyltransferase